MTTDAPRRRGRPPSGGREAIITATLELLRERGIANLTTREVAARAGVSDASVYYHFGDRAGLLQAVFEHGMQPLAYLNDLDAAGDRREVLAHAARVLERFFEEVLPVLLAAQADPELRDALASYAAANDLGPHRGVATLGAYLRREQAAGRVNPEADVEAVAIMLIHSCFGRVTQRQMKMIDHLDELPSIDRVVDSINRLLD